MDKKETFLNLVDDFVSETMYGNISGMWKHLLSQGISNEDVPKTLLILENFMITFLVKYMNRAYVSLITHEDMYYVKKFREMKNVLGHGYRCLLNIVFVRLINLLKMLPSYVEKIEFDLVRFQLKNTKEFFMNILSKNKKDLAKSFSHQCQSKNEDISKWDPNKKMFHISYHK